jgi:hypothetical protein
VWKSQNPDKLRGYQKTYHSKNREVRGARAKAWKRRNGLRNALNQRRWVELNRGRVNAYVARRRAKKLFATPIWSDRELIDRFYSDCPPGYHVDHIVPLISDKVCGLHVISNLQYLPALENLSKGNRLLEKYL